MSAGAPCKEIKFPVRDVAMIVCLLFAMIVTIECNYMYVCMYVVKSMPLRKAGHVV